MKITKHITFFYSEKTKDRIVYLNKILEETNKYPYITNIFIHTNYPFSSNLLVPNTNGTTTIVTHDLGKEHPFYLTWKCRELLYKQKDEYDIFIYTEDDILIPKTAIIYWLENKDKVLQNNFNLGFLRIEVNDEEELMTDFFRGAVPLNIIISIDDKQYAVNNRNPYCAMWIYDKSEFSRFINSSYWSMKNIEGYEIREKSAIGLHGIHTRFYKGTILPIVEDQIDSACKIYHLPNNYIHDNLLAFKNAIAPESLEN